VEDFRLACFGLVAKGELEPKYLIEQGMAQKLNVIFDIDHTLIYSIPESFVPQTNL